jgi:hypothetical protein
MGKRSDFKRVEKDFYRTIDPRAVDTLLPFLVPGSTYAEPCYGVGDLAMELNHKANLNLQWASDITVEGWYKLTVPIYERDALTLTTDDMKDCDLIITNPPWSRDILHPMIEHFASLKTTWLLFDSDWAYTKQASLYLEKYCTDIVAIGRLKWIPDTSMQGKDNCSWYKFVHPDIKAQYGIRFTERK